MFDPKAWRDACRFIRFDPNGRLIGRDDPPDAYGNAREVFGRSIRDGARIVARGKDGAR